MKSTIQINSVTPKVWRDPKDNSDKHFQVIIFDGNKEASSWKDDFLKFVGQTLEVDVNTNAKGKMTLALVAGTSAPAPTPTNTPKQSCGCDDEFGVRKSAMLLNIEMFKASGVTIDGPKFWSVLKDVETYLQNGNTPGQV